MKHGPAQITLREWDERYNELSGDGLKQSCHGGRLERYVEDGDYRLRKLLFDNSAASLRLWDFLLSESGRLFEARKAGKTVIGTMKDLGTVPVMAYSLPDTVAFYPDGAWWVPCIMEQTTEDLAIAEANGFDESFCPVRAMLGAFFSGLHFPQPDLLICSAGATCDDFAAIAQSLNSLGWPIFWWEIVPRRAAGEGESRVLLPGGFEAVAGQVAFVRGELMRVRRALENVAGRRLGDEDLAAGIRAANRVRRLLLELRHLVFTAKRCPLPALEILIAEMLSIHYCSDRDKTIAVLEELLAEVRRRVAAEQGFFDRDAARIFWVNPVADLYAMNLLEKAGGRLCGTEFMFCHALDEIPEDLPPMEALARMALADPMVGTSQDRAKRVARDARLYGAEGVVISRIPGASHCALEGAIIGEHVRRELGLPVVEMEVPPLCDSMEAALRNRLEALVETVKEWRKG